MVNGVAPALIRGTKMLPGNPEELAKSGCIQMTHVELNSLFVHD